MASSGSPSNQHESQEPGYGVTKPISLAGPTEHDFINTRELERYLHDNGCYESSEEALLKEQVIARLDQVVMMWVKEVSRSKGLNDQLVIEANAKIFTFGSYRIGVIDADVGLLCVGPRHITREEDFLGTLWQMLSQMAEVTELDSFHDADMPKLKFKFNGISIDLLYARLCLWVIPYDLNISQETVLQDVDEQTIRALNCYRDTDKIFHMIPNIQNFRTALRAITFWARLRGLYSDVMGFLGTMSWALLVARVCQLYPNASPNMLVSRFFRVYSLWRWPNPVLLCDIKEGSLILKNWDPRINSADRYDRMPIITPTYPHINSSSNISSSNLYILSEEFKKGNEICEAMETNVANWKSLFEPFQFFEAYKNYLQIDITAGNRDDLRAWKYWVESRLHKLTQKIERDTSNMLRSRPHPDAFSDKSRPFHLCYFVGLQRNRGIHSKVGECFDIRSTVDEFKFCVNMYIMWKPGMEISVFHVKGKNLPAFVFPGGIRPAHESEVDGEDGENKRN